MGKGREVYLRIGTGTVEISVKPKETMGTRIITDAVMDNARRKDSVDIKK